MRPDMKRSLCLIRSMFFHLVPKLRLRNAGPGSSCIHEDHRRPMLPGDERFLSDGTLEALRTNSPWPQPDLMFLRNAERQRLARSPQPPPPELLPQSQAAGFHGHLILQQVLSRLEVTRTTAQFASQRSHGNLDFAGLRFSCEDFHDPTGNQINVG